jgi:hypothetical protein
MGKEQVTIRLEASFHEEFMDLVDEHDTSKSAMGRELLRDGYEARKDDQIAEELREIHEKIPRTDGGADVVASKREVEAIRQQQQQQQRASAIANAGIGAGVVYLAALTFYSLPGSVVAIFGALILGIILYAVYRMSAFVPSVRTEPGVRPSGGDEQ